MRKLLLLPLLSLLSCQGSSDPLTAAPPTDHAVIEDTASLSAGSLAPNDTAVRLDTVGLSPEPTTPVKLLLEGSFHKAEVWKDAEKRQWMGLFYKDGRYVLQPTRLHVGAVQDPVADESSKVLSGRAVSADSAGLVFFVSGLPKATAGAVDTAAYTQSTLLANKSLTYTFRGKSYTISSYGDSTLMQNSEYRYRNYGWRVSCTRSGKKLTQTLAEDESFEESVYVLLWAGDLDRDGIPDLLLDLSNHYNVSRYTLFLSSMAERGNLYKKVALFETVGC